MGEGVAANLTGGRQGTRGGICENYPVGLDVDHIQWIREGVENTVQEAALESGLLLGPVLGQADSDTWCQAL